MKYTIEETARAENQLRDIITAGEGFPLYMTWIRSTRNGRRVYQFSMPSPDSANKGKPGHRPYMQYMAYTMCVLLGVSNEKADTHWNGRIMCEEYSVEGALRSVYGENWQSVVRIDRN
jgi:hypothetical protein